MNATPVIERLRLFEGSVPYMYRCTGGEVTVGIGHAILTPGSAIGLTWQKISSTERPSDDVIEADYQRVAAAPKGRLAKTYESLSTCRMPDDAISLLADSDIVTYTLQIERRLPDWDTWPEPAQEALFDMAFNLGIGGLMRFTKMLNACAKGDWGTAAAESKRLGVPNTRNEAIRQLFLDAKASPPQEKSV